MHNNPSALLEKSRLIIKGWETGEGTMSGAFQIGHLRIIASHATIVPDSEGWEHVSVSTPDRCPTWEEMCVVKDLFWPETETVFQLHPPKSEWVNNHPFCLHLWRNVFSDPPMPPSVMVGIKGDGVYKNKEEAEAGYQRALKAGLLKGKV